MPPECSSTHVEFLSTELPDMPLRVYVFVFATCALGLTVVATALLVPQPTFEWSWWVAAFLLVAMVLAEARAVELTRESDQAVHSVSISTVPHLAAALLLPPWLAAVLAG